MELLIYLLIPQLLTTMIAATYVFAAVKKYQCFFYFENLRNPFTIGPFMRLKFIQSIIFSSLGLIVCGLFYMQIIYGGYYHRQSTNNRIRVVPIDGPRGRILDRNGVVLADNRIAFHVGVISQDVEDKKALFDYLGQVLDRDPVFLERQFQRKKIASFAPVILAQGISRELAVKIEEEKFVYPGLIVQQGFERFYPFNESGAHVLGYVGKINEDEVGDYQQYGYTPLTLVGKTGVEKQI